MPTESHVFQDGVDDAEDRAKRAGKDREGSDARGVRDDSEVAGAVRDDDAGCDAGASGGGERGNDADPHEDHGTQRDRERYGGGRHSSG